AGWTCQDVTLPSGVESVCIPQFAHHCSHCSSDGECGSGACLTIDGEQRCAASCTSGPECPAAHHCGVDGTGAHPGKYCQPESGSCSCTPAMAGATRTCSVTNAIGTCWGDQLCDAASGWSACSATTPAPEVCDGVDNDCNFVIDDGVGGGDP